MVNAGFAERDGSEERVPEGENNIIDLTRSSMFQAHRTASAPKTQALAEPILIDQDPVLGIAKEVHKALRGFLEEERSRSGMQAGFLAPELKALPVGDLLRVLGNAVLKLEGLFEKNSHASVSMVETLNKVRAIRGGIAQFHGVLAENSPEGRLKNTATVLVAASALSLQSGLAGFIEQVNEMVLRRYYGQAGSEDPSGMAS